MFWSESGLIAMLALRIVFYSGSNWHSDWKHLDVAKKCMTPAVATHPPTMGKMTGNHSTTTDLVGKFADA